MVQKSLTRFQAKGKGKHPYTNLLGKDTLSYVPLGTSDRILDLMVTNGATHLNHCETKFESFYFFVSHTKRKRKKKNKKRKKEKNKENRKRINWITSCLLIRLLICNILRVTIVGTGCCGPTFVMFSLWGHLLQPFGICLFGCSKITLIHSG